MREHLIPAVYGGLVDEFSPETGQVEFKHYQLVEIVVEATSDPLDLADPRAVHKAHLLEGETSRAPRIRTGGRRALPVARYGEMDDVLGAETTVHGNEGSERSWSADRL